MSNESPIWNPEFETMSRQQLQEVQLQRLKTTVERAYHKVPFYKRALDEKGIKPDDIKTIDDLRKLPFTYKQDFRDTYPFGLFAEPLENVVRLQATSGTTAKPIIVGYNRNDLESWAEVNARSLSACGVTKYDIVQNAYGYGLFTGGLGVHLGAERIGATVIPISGGLSQRQLMFLEDVGSTVLTCTPSYALSLVETMEDTKVDRNKIKLRVGIFGAEPWSEAMRDEIESRWKILALNIYGLAELTGPGVGCECTQKAGMHIWEDYFIPEIIDPITGDPLPYGQEGELVFTSLKKEVLPVIRYRTRDRTHLIAEPCACGRTHVRMGRITGRTDDMLVIRGVNLFPSQIETAILRVPEIEPQYVIVVDRQQTQLDNIEVRAEATEELWAKGQEAIDAVIARLRHEIHEVTLLNVIVKVVEPKSIQRSEGKAKRVFDLREL